MLMLAGSFAAARGLEGNLHFADIQCETVNVAHIDTDSVNLELTLAGMANKSFTVESIYFDHVTVNGMPLRVAPLRGPFRFRKGKAISGLPTLSAVASFREIPSLQPLRRTVDIGSAHIHIEVLARLDLNPVEILALRARDLWVSTKLDQDTQISIPGGSLGRLAALATLTAAEPAWELGSRGRKWLDARSDFSQEAQRDIENSLVEIETSFSIHCGSDGGQTLVSRTIGFILPSGRILTVNEAVEPWIYSASLAQAVRNHQGSVDTDSVDILIRPATSSPRISFEFSMRKGQVRILKSEKKTAHVTSDASKVYRLALRDTPENGAVLEVAGLPAVVGPRVRVGNQSTALDHQQAAVFRFDSQSGLTVAVSEVRQEDGRLVLRDASPASAGSPVWLDSGVVGLLQDDSSGATIASVLKAFPSEAF